MDVSCVNTKYRSAYERFSTCYRTIHHIVRERDWQDYPAEEVADAFEDISRYPFDGRPGVFVWSLSRVFTDSGFSLFSDHRKE